MLQSCAEIILPNKPTQVALLDYFTFSGFSFSSVMSYNIILQLLSLSKVCGNSIHAYSYMILAFQRCLASRFHVVLTTKNCMHAFKGSNSSFVSILCDCCLMLISIHRENVVVLH